MIEAHRLAVLRGEEHALRDLARAYDVIRSVLRSKQREINRLIAEAQALGNDPGYKLFEQARYKLLLQQVNAALKEFSEKAEGITEKNQEKTAELGVKHSEELMKLEVNARRAFTQLPKAAIDTMVGALSDGSPLATLFGTIAPTASQGLADAMIAGIANGDNPRKVAKALAVQVEKLTLERATTIARNETLRVYTTAQARNYEANNDVITGMRVVSALDGRTCPLCWARHGTILKPGEPFHRHICCRCSLAPQTAYSKKWATGEQEFALLPEEEQRKILKGSRYELWKSGSVQLSDIYKLGSHAQWGPQIGLLPITKLKKLAKPAGTYSPPPIDKDTRSVRSERTRLGIASK